MKLENIKARKLKRGDKIVIGGVKYKIVHLSLHFGGKRDRVSMSLRDPKNDTDVFSHNSMSVPANSRFTVTRKS